jgi:tetratricopeptide (TPR) repeat protein
MTQYFDLISLFSIFICVQALWQLRQNWSKFWDPQVTAKDQELAQRLATFILIPLGVLLHEIGHSLATWQVGGTVLAFQWRFYWGYIIPFGDFSAVDSWWISFSGNLVSILLALLPIPFIPYIRKRVVGELLYSFVCMESIYSLVAYPIMSFALRGGDWVKIYDFTMQPYAQLTAIAHVALLWGLWNLYHSRKAIAWRLSRDANTLKTWEQLKVNRAKRPNDLTSHLELAYFLLQNNEVHAAKKVGNTINKLAPDDNRVRFFQVALDYNRRAYRKAVKSGQQLLNTDLSLEDKLRLYGLLCFSLYNLRRLPEALFYANQGLEIAPTDYKLRYRRSSVYQMQGKSQDAKVDLEVAIENAPDEESRQQLQEWLRRKG